MPVLPGAPSILVFGATGAVGGSLLGKLRPEHEAGTIRLLAATRRAGAAEELRATGVEPRIVDLDEAEQRGLAGLEAALIGIDRVFLATGYDVKMLAQSKAVIDAAAQSSVSHLVHLGAHAAPATTIVHLGWHQLIEAYLAKSGIGHTNLHPTSFMQNLFLLIGSGGAPAGVLPHYIGDGVSSWVDGEDVAAVAAAVLLDPAQHSGRSYLLGAEAASMAAVAETLSSVTGRPWTAEPRDPQRFFETVSAAGADPIYMACVRTIFERTAAGSLPDLAETSDAIETLLGRPARSIRDFAEEHRAQFLALAAPAA